MPSLRPLETLLVSPRYRGWVTDDGPTTAEVRARFLWDDVPGGADAIGYTFEYDLHLYMKRAWALASRYGDAAFHRRRIRPSLVAQR